MEFNIKKTTAFLILLIAISLVIQTCAPYKDSSTEIQYELQPDGIQIRYIADSMLNLYNYKPHALTLVVYQLKTPDIYYKHSADVSGLEKLINVDFENDPSVTAINKLTIQPESEKNEILVRYTDTGWVAVIAAYDNLAPGYVNKLFKIPTGTRKRFLRRARTSVETLYIKITFGPTKIIKVSYNNGIG